MQNEMLFMLHVKKEIVLASCLILHSVRSLSMPSPASRWRGALRAHSFYPGATISLEGYREELEVSRRDRPAFQTLRRGKGLLKLRDTKSLEKRGLHTWHVATISSNWRIITTAHLGKEFLSNAVIGTIYYIFSEK